MAHETVDQFLARKRRERNGSVELSRVSSASELFQIDQLRAQRGGSTETGNTVRDLYGRLQLDGAQQQAVDQGGGGLFSSFGAFATKISEPLIDLPDLPGPLNLIEEGIEELSSPIGLAATALAPITGGTSLGLTGLTGLAARGATIAAAEVLVGGAAVAASSAVNDRLPENTPAALRLIANLGVGIGAAGAVSTGIRRSIAGNATDEIIRNIRSPEAQKLGQILADTPELIRRNAEDLTAFRAERFAAFDDALRQGPFTESRFRSAKRSLSGVADRSGDAELEAAIRGQFTPREIDGLYGELGKAWDQGLSSGDILSAEEGLTRLLRGEVPQQNQWDRLDAIFGSGLRNVVEQHGKGAGQQALDLVLDLANVPRSLAASMDFSAPLRQGVMLIGHPKEFTGAFKVMIKSAFDEDFANHIVDDLSTGVKGRRLRDAGVDITDFRPGSLTRHEEQFISRTINLIPGLGKLTRGSERAYTIFLNKLRADVFDSTISGWRAGGKAVSAQDTADLAKFVNFATGRGSAKFLEGTSGRLMSAAFFSPKFLTSRFQAPALLLTATPAVRRQVAKDMGIFIGAGVGVLTLLKTSGVADVELDPRSSDFGKGRVGNTRFDFWGGYQQIVRYTTQAITNERKSTASGDIVGLNRAETVGRFFQSKLSPPAGLATDVLRGETIINEELDPNIDTLSEQALARAMPFFFQDVHESFTKSGLAVGAATIPLSLFGVGSTSFSSTSELVEQFGLDKAEPHERLAILAQNPELAEELVRRNEISAERGSEAAQRRLVLDEIREVFTSRQEAADSMMLTGQLSPSQWRAQRRVISNAERNQIQSLFRDVEPGPETPLSRFFGAIESATDQVGQVDWDQVDLWKARQPQTDQDFIDRNTGLRDTDLERAYKETLSDLDEVGFFDIRGGVWAQLAPQAGLTQFATYDDWRGATLNQLAQLFTQQGIAPELARQEAERRLATHQVQKAFSRGMNALQQQFLVQNPELARQAAKWELFSTTIEERQFLSAS